MVLEILRRMGRGIGLHPWMPSSILQNIMDRVLFYIFVGLGAGFLICSIIKLSLS